ncbi:hypothetical protein A3C75_03290 [Candidatus Giovannonibacteria bacterium RIFCSPHIGHO2_02_FULL_44_31]|uniref:Glycosyltransferase subfamily 4-like N-terminal domain-containing protein n=1 Tax=Candidatus Giovannonibacteria bacterium RIFCSPLOWO2_12_FULL_44_15 TaxID=1798364 RepID=A0A1F5Y0Q6_9BACT|nr:MAG: hypothetical protein A3C75_03290 [Candidatus Giovannonibacteria bacterium RIFCSPHIGHO2_02_FULL_44_31]OGF76669.1 MAG: hypothetical protein A3E62_03500 [Candidatus Giovannonibacteria bacterium RIFCSPHIGHO2_12_FULL_44_29]OGF93755.1 MAG: hypothetical protein A3G54_04360 [Candidatus Giovannonibacteria bacterium RIFCSPLOWO2_12_FULL_44_15]
MKRILIPVSNSFFVRNFLRTEGLKILLGRPEIEPVFLVPKNKLEYYQKEFASPRITFLAIPSARGVFENFFKFLETSSIHTRTILMQQYFYLKRAGAQENIFLRYFIFFLGRFLWLLGKFYWWRNFLRYLYWLAPNARFKKIFENIKPDLVFCPTLIYDEYLLLKTAKKKGIKTLGMISSWDNFYSKTFLRVYPDYLLVQTNYLKSLANNLADYPLEKIAVTGVPQYDRYFSKSGVVSREEFIKSLGGNPGKKLILYAFSGKMGITVDFEMLDILSMAFKEGKISKSTQVLVRPYPKNDFSPERVLKTRERFGFLVRPVAGHIGGGKGNWEFEEESLAFLLNSLAHADVIINMYSTFFIEGAIFDKPLIAVAFDGHQRLDYWNSARRFFDWDHLADIKKSGGISIVKSPEELMSAINSCLGNPNFLSEGRKKIVSQQAGFYDGNSAKRIAENILKFI